LDSLDKQGMET